MVFGAMAASQDQQDFRRPSTAEERQRFVALVHKLEESPLDPNLKEDTQWALKWIEGVTDVNVTICSTPLGDLPEENYQYKNRIGVQYTLAMGAFLIEHPDKAGNTYSQYLAGVQSALKTYSAILKSKPSAKSRALDKLQTAQKDGKLPDLIREAAKLCDETNRT